MPLVFELWAFQDASELKYPFSSVTTTWLSPVVTDLSLKATPAKLALPFSAFLENSKSLLFTWSWICPSLVPAVTISPSSSMLNS